MPLSESFERAVAAAFDVHTPWSGTENVGPWLHWLVRMTRPRTVVEFGTGYTTAYLARAVADNHRELDEHRERLGRRAAANRAALAALLGHEIWERSEPDVAELSELVFAACAAEPGEGVPAMPDLAYLERARPPHLDCFEAEPEDSEYVRRLRGLLDTLGLAHAVTLHAGVEIAGYLSRLPPDRLPVDLAWNDFGDKLRFFEETDPFLAPDGGLFATHSPVDFAGEVAEIKARVAGELASGRREALTLREPHKLMQNACFLLRRCPPPAPSRSHRDAMRELVEGLLALAPAE